MVSPIQNPCDFGTPEPCGVNPAYKYTRYPCDFDTPRPAQDTRGLPIIVDLQTPVKGEVVNRHREAILAIENELGIQPSGTFATVRARLDALEGLLCSIWNTITDSGSPINVQFNGSTVVAEVEKINFSGGVVVTDAGNKQVNVNVIGGDGYSPVHELLAVTTNGQTAFSLSKTPGSNSVLLFVGGIKQEIANYSVSGSILTWSGSVSLLTTDVVEVLYFEASSGGGGGGGTGTSMSQEVFTASAAQVNFTLSQNPINQQSTEMFIDGISMTVGIDYTLSGNVVTYNNSPSLSGGEDVVIKYLYT